MQKQSDEKNIYSNSKNSVNGQPHAPETWIENNESVPEIKHVFPKKYFKKSKTEKNLFGCVYPLFAEWV